MFFFPDGNRTISLVNIQETMDRSTMLMGKGFCLYDFTISLWIQSCLLKGSVTGVLLYIYIYIIWMVILVPSQWPWPWILRDGLLPIDCNNILNDPWVMAWKCLTYYWILLFLVFLGDYQVITPKPGGANRIGCDWDEVITPNKSSEPLRSSGKVKILI